MYNAMENVKISLANKSLATYQKLIWWGRITWWFADNIKSWP